MKEFKNDRELLEEIHSWLCFIQQPSKKDTEDLRRDIKNHLEKKVSQIEPPVMPKIADTTNITMWVDMIWNDIFDDDELDFNPRQMNIIGKYVNDAKEKIRKQFSV